ncbi:MAG: metallophosphoesterase [Bacteroidaceae bacterium]|nr:metallophosphoesterase [Bacteroidaceae bacterium]
MDRRNFIKGAVMVAASASVPDIALAATPKSEAKEAAATDKLIDSAPVLQNYAASSMGVAFSVTAPANGYVIVGEQPDLSDGRKVVCGGYRVTDMNDEVMLVRLTGLRPATTYYYRIGADRIHYGGGYDIRVLGTEEDPRIYHFTTAGAEAKAHFCVINDTHAEGGTFNALTDKIARISPSCVVWNGDACNVEEKIDSLKRILLTPSSLHPDFASQTPYLFVPGNHDSRGMACRHIERVWMFRQMEERQSRDWDLGRNFAVRMGDIALIGLDTAEDKVDENPKFGGLFCSHAYRRAQALWLEEALRQPDIRRAPYLVVCCHIPLYDDNPRQNPGDVHPADADPRYDTDFAGWQRECAQLWGPHLQKAGCQLVITAHQHNYQVFPAGEGRCWTQLVGGGPSLKAKSTSGYPTIIEGDVADGKLRIIVHNMVTGDVQQTLTFAPRRRR